MSGSIKEIKRRHSEPLTISKHSDSTIDTNSLDSRRQTIIFHLTRGQHKRITFEVSFRRTITIMGIKRKLSSLLDLEEANIIISFRKVPLPDHARLCDIDEDTIEMELKTKDNTLINASKINTLKNGIQIPKQSATVATCKFHVVNQNCTFTKSYKSEQKVQDIKKDLCSTFGVSEDFLILVVNKKILDNCNMLSELDMDDFGNLYLELFTKGGIKLKMDMIYKEITVADVLAVTVATSPSTFITINVEIVDERIKKPFLGGFRNKLTGKIFQLLKFKTY